MALKLGGTFLVCAMGPLNYASSCIQASRMPEGIRELAPEGLLAGFRRGIVQAAKLAGVGVEDVERVLPMDEVRDAIERLTSSHPEALMAWDIHAGRIGGLLQGVAELTAYNRPPDASECLQRLARKVRRDRPFSEPLEALASDVAHWQATITRCCKLLDESGGGALARAYRRRRIRRVAVAVASGLLVAAVIALALRVQVSRARVEALLQSEEICAVRGIDGDDLGRASGEQQRRVAERMAACAEVEARQARELEARRRAEEQAREEQRLRAERDERCASLAQRLKAGALSREDEELAGEHGAALLRRIAQGRLIAADVGPGDPPLPCAGARGGDELFAAFADALVASVWTWGPASDPSPKVTEVLEARRTELSERSRLMLALRAETVSRQAITSGDPAALAQASRLCALGIALQSGGGPSCAALARVLAKRSQ